MNDFAIRELQGDRSGGAVWTPVVRVVLYWSGWRNTLVSEPAAIEVAC